MKHIKANIVVLLEKMRDSTITLRDMYEIQGNDRWYRYYQGEAVGLDEAIRVLTDKADFTELVQIYMDNNDLEDMEK